VHTDKTTLNQFRIVRLQMLKLVMETLPLESVVLVVFNETDVSSNDSRRRWWILGFRTINVCNCHASVPNKRIPGPNRNENCQQTCRLQRSYR
jgi:hypothetical protein